jgi:hypothetical protein
MIIYQRNSYTVTPIQCSFQYQHSHYPDAVQAIKITLNVVLITISTRNETCIEEAVSTDYYTTRTAYIDLPQVNWYADCGATQYLNIFIVYNSSKISSYISHQILYLIPKKHQSVWCCKRRTNSNLVIKLRSPYVPNADIYYCCVNIV